MFQLRQSNDAFPLFSSKWGHSHPKVQSVAHHDVKRSHYKSIWHKDHSRNHFEQACRSRSNRQPSRCKHLALRMISKALAPPAWGWRTLPSGALSGSPAAAESSPSWLPCAVRARCSKQERFIVGRDLGLYPRSQTGEGGGKHEIVHPTRSFGRN